MFKILASITILTFIPSAVVSASGLSVSPSALNFDLNAGQSVTKTLIIANPTGDVLVFEVYADEFKNMFSISPSSFTLESGARKEVKISIDSNNINEYPLISTNLSVVGSALAEGKSNVAAGAKIPVSISGQNSPSKPINKTPLIIIGALLAAAAAYNLGKKSRV